jgi:hypothetical protein
MFRKEYVIHLSIHIPGQSLSNLFCLPRNSFFSMPDLIRGKAEEARQPPGIAGYPPVFAGKTTLIHSCCKYRFSNARRDP